MIRILLAAFVVCSGVTMHGAFAEREHRAAKLRWTLRPLTGDFADDGWRIFHVRRVCGPQRCKLYQHLPDEEPQLVLTYPRDRYLHFDGPRLSVLEVAPTPVRVPPPTWPRWVLLLALALASLRALSVGHAQARERERFFAQSWWVEVEAGGRVRLPDGVLGRSATHVTPGSATLIARREGPPVDAPYRAETEELVELLPGHPTVHLARAAREQGRMVALAAAVVMSVIAQIVVVVSV